MSDPGTAAAVARAVLAGFDKHYRLFRAVSSGARERFERGDWAAVRAAHRARVDMYDLRVREAVTAIRARFPAALGEEPWPEVKRAYLTLLYEHQQPELAETFFNSVACRLLGRSYRHNKYIFWRPGVSTEHIDSLRRTYRSYAPAAEGGGASLRRLLLDAQLLLPWEDLERDVRRLGEAFAAALPEPLAARASLQLQVLSSPFFRNQAAYLIGRVEDGSARVPFAIPLRRSARGELYVDALLLRGDELLTLFSLSRAYFMVDMEVPSAFVSFLSSVVPGKPRAEVYVALGLQKQGKTLFYRHLFEHLRHSDDRFVAAPGVKGMVMLVFMLPSFPYVFKIIRDAFEPPKDTDRETVKQRYRWVKLHDRVGRMVDALEYSDVALPLHRFDPALLDELAEKAPSLLSREEDWLVIQHLYIERRVTPLDVALREAGEGELRAGLREYGRALRELAAANIFPGDLLLKNFGLTRLGRVLFYDYDEIVPLEECEFRSLPAPPGDEEELSGEPWFHVGPRDVFPEEFPRFLFSARQRQVFLEEHPDLFTAAFWQRQQEEIRAGREEEVPSYGGAFPRPVT
ncbi:MAG: bifunctional isocitrate dehydrogenase kinase/phosphatase [Myxococcales bacterium]